MRVVKGTDLVTEVPLPERHGLTAREIVEKGRIDQDEDQNPIEIILPRGGVSNSIANN